MSKRDNPRLWEKVNKDGKNKRSNHSIGRDGRLQKDSSPKPAGKPSRTGGMRSAKPAATRRVTEAIKSGRSIDKILMQKDAEGSAKKIASMARENGLQLQYVDRIVLDKLCPGRPHQGVAAYVAAKEYADLDDIFAAAAAKGEDPLIVLLDGLEDPHNLGAVLRSCDGAGAHGVVIPARRAVGLTETVAKASAGAIEYVPVVKVTNLGQCIDKLKERGVWIAAVDMDGENYSDARLTGPLALVIGGEGQGVSQTVRSKADYIVSIPMKGRVNSLNASNAAAILLYEVDRQRSLAAKE